jgi:hypothetical protein
MISENSRGQKLFQGDAREDDSKTMVVLRIILGKRREKEEERVDFM